MKVLFITHYTDLYGANQSLLNLIDGLTAYNVQIEILAPYNGESLFRELDRRNIPVHTRVFGWAFFEKEKARSIKGWNYLKTFLKDVYRVYRLIKETGPNIVYTNTSVIDVGLWASKLAGKKHVWHIREFGSKDYDLYPYWGNSYFKFALFCSDKVIFISEVLKKFYNIKSKRQNVVYNGVGFQHEFDKAAPFVKKDILHLGFVGVIIPNKGVQEIIEALIILRSHKLSNFNLLIYGTGDDLHIEELKQIVKENKLEDAVHFMGFEKNKETIYQNIDYLIVPSKAEAFGRVVAEAMLRKKIVIGKNQGAIPELINDKVTGILYNSTAPDLAEKIKWVSENQDKMDSIAGKAFDHALLNFTTEKYSSAIYTILKGQL